MTTDDAFPATLLRIERGERLLEVVGHLWSLAKNLGMVDTAVVLDLAMTAIDVDLDRWRQG